MRRTHLNAPPVCSMRAVCRHDGARTAATCRTDKDGEKSSKGTSTTTTTSKPPAYPDYQEYVVCVDVRQYHLCFNHLTDMRNNYLKAHVLFEKNMKKLTDPRGDGDGKSVNVMSMF